MKVDKNVFLRIYISKKTILKIIIIEIIKF